MMHLYGLDHDARKQFERGLCIKRVESDVGHLATARRLRRVHQIRERLGNTGKSVCSCVHLQPRLQPLSPLPQVIESHQCIGMGMRQKDGVDVVQAVMRKPSQCALVEGFAAVDQNRAGLDRDMPIDSPSECVVQSPTGAE